MEVRLLHQPSRSPAHGAAGASSPAAPPGASLGRVSLVTKARSSEAMSFMRASTLAARPTPPTGCSGAGTHEGCLPGSSPPHPVDSAPLDTEEAAVPRPRPGGLAARKPGPGPRSSRRQLSGAGCRVSLTALSRCGPSASRAAWAPRRARDRRTRARPSGSPAKMGPTTAPACLLASWKPHPTKRPSTTAPTSRRFSASACASGPPPPRPPSPPKACRCCCSSRKSPSRPPTVTPTGTSPGTALGLPSLSTSPRHRVT
mmetsp:Transcript_26541/g.59393  ORF Transcript_26541/g.59393 Transcript_26541/m.59393 type:complete len:258 (+) Transcript_26541:1886-2659(+)